MEDKEKKRGHNREGKEIKENREKIETEEKPSYIPPLVITYSEDEILEELGTIQACVTYDTTCGVLYNIQEDNAGF